MEFPLVLKFRSGQSLKVFQIPHNCNHMICPICFSFAMAICNNCRFPISPGCIHMSIDEVNFCENCNTISKPMIAKEIKSESKFLESKMRNMILVYCKYWRLGCNTIIPLSNLLKHQKKCVYRPNFMKHLLVSKFMKRKRNNKLNSIKFPLINLSDFKKKISFLKQPVTSKCLCREIIINQQIYLKFPGILFKFLMRFDLISFENVNLDLNAIFEHMRKWLTYPSSIEKISFTNCQIDPIIFSIFLKNQLLNESIKFLEFDNCKILNEDSLNYINQFSGSTKKLQEIKFQKVSFDSDSQNIQLNKMINSFLNSTNIITLEFNTIPIISSSIIKYLKQLVSISKIVFQNCNLRPTGKFDLFSLTLCSLKKLKYLDLSMNKTLCEDQSDFISNLARSSSIQFLILNDNNLSMEDASYFIEKNKSIKYLHVQNMIWDENNAQIFSNKLSTNKFIETLDLSCSNHPLDESFFQIILSNNALRNSISKLILQASKIDERSCNIIGDLILKNENLNSIDLGKPVLIHKQGLVFIKKAIQQRNLNQDKFILP